MDRNTIKKEIVELVSSIKGQSEVLANEKYPSQLDLELFLHKVERLYQKSIVFHHLTMFDGFEVADAPRLNAPPVPDPVSKKEEKPVETISQPETPEQKNSTETKKEEVVTSEQKTAPAMIPEIKEDPVSPPVFRSFPDLKSVMGINDKFQFTNELFKGNMQEFNIAIEQLNAAESAQSATNYLKSLHQLYGWDEEHETLKRFLSIVEKRYV